MGLSWVCIHIYRDGAKAEWCVRAKVADISGFSFVLTWGFPDQQAAFAQARKVWEIHGGAS